MMDGANVLAFETAAAERVEYYASPGAAVDTNLVISSSYSPAQQRHMLRAHAMRPGELRYRRIYGYGAIFLCKLLIMKLDTAKLFKLCLSKG